MSQVSITRVAKGVAIAIVVPLVFAMQLCAGWLIWGSWISPFERRAMKSALDRIDGIASYDGSDQTVYDQRVQLAQAAILECQKKEITGYDRQLVPLLNFQLDGAQTEHKFRLKAKTDARYAQALAKFEMVDRETEAMLREHLR